MLFMSLGLNAIIVIVIATLFLWFNQSIGLTVAAFAFGLPAVSLSLAWVVAKAAVSGDPWLWFDAWARSHLLVLVQWLLLADSISDRPFFRGDIGFILWVILALCMPIAAGLLFQVLCRRRGLDSVATVSGFMKLMIAFTVVNTLLLISIGAWTMVRQLMTIAC